MRSEARDPVEQALAHAASGPAPLLPFGARVLVACSGGADSLALLVALERMSSALGLTVSIGHVDHGLRDEAAGEARFVGEHAQRLGLPFHLARLPDLRFAIRRDGLEAAAREGRYAALERLALEAGADRVATAHTRTDQAETVLLRLARGGGPGALAGVRALRPLGSTVVVRPLLTVSRDATHAYCTARGLRPTLDPHNSDPRRARTRARAAISHLAIALNPRLEEALAGAAALAADEDALIATICAEALDSARVGADSYEAARLAGLPAALQRRCLLVLAAAAGARPERAHLEQLRALLGGPDASLDLPGGRAGIASGLLRVEKGPRPPPAQGPPPLLVGGPGRYRWGECDLTVGESVPGAFRIDLAKAPLPWTMRARRPGDRFRPAGGHAGKVSDQWIAAQVPRSLRPALALLEDAGGSLFFVEGLRPSSAASGGGPALAVALRRISGEMDRSGAALSPQKQAGPPRASMLPHRPDEEPR